jgi:hypothetical protein
MALDHGDFRGGPCSRGLAVTVVLILAWLAVSTASSLGAQGVTTATLRGTVSPGDATVRIVNEATGYHLEIQARDGRFTSSGLEIGGPYVVLIRRIGFAAQEQRVPELRLGETLELSFFLSSIPRPLDTIRVSSMHRAFGTGLTISDSLLHRLPTLNRDMYDFAGLVPQISTKVGLAIGGISGGGANVRFNNFQIDGATDRVVPGNSSTGSAPLDAVREFEVLVAPFDVRFGDFAGTLVNAVTKTGTNQLHASGFVYQRNERLARPVNDSLRTPYNRTQFGFTAGGPLIRDRLHFLLSPEIERLSSPAAGPFLGQAAGAYQPVPVTNADVARFASIMKAKGLEPGSGGAVKTGNPTTNVLARLDLTLPELSSRAVVIQTYGRADNAQFSRATADTFSLSSYRVTQANAVRLTSLQLHTNLSSGAYNALTVSFRDSRTRNLPDVQEPVVIVPVPRVGSGGTVILKAGTQEGGQGVSMGAQSVIATENLTMPVGRAHTISVGGQTEWFHLDRRGVNGSYGTWTFANLDSFETGRAQRYQIRQDFGSASSRMRAAQNAAYVGDEWRIGERVSAMFGLRADAFAILDHPLYQPLVDSLFGRRTDQIPAARIHLSPRVGFNWDVFGTGRDQIHGGAGVFTGRYPAAWAQVPLYSYGTGLGTLQCGSVIGDRGPAPTFVPDYRAAPTSCANGLTLSGAPRGDVDLMDRHLRMAQSLRASLAYDRRLPWEMTMTGEAMITRGISDFVFVNLNLRGPQGVDQHGRVMYGTISNTGSATTSRVSVDFPEVIDLQNVSSSHALQLDARLEKRFRRGYASASYTFSRVRDAALPIRSGVRGTVVWMSERVVAGRHDEYPTGVSLYDLPHRVVLTTTFTAPWRRPTDFSLYYIGESGSPFTYIAGGAGRGDLNADGVINDPLYIPTNAADPNQIHFDGSTSEIATQQQALEQLIAGTPCLRRQRGAVMGRNSCREPWSHTSIASIRHTLPLAGSHAVAVHMDVFNVLNLLSSRWGQYRVANPTLLSQIGETGPAGPSQQPTFRYDLTMPRWTTLTTESSYQLQLALRYSF